MFTVMLLIDGFTSYWVTTCRYYTTDMRVGVMKHVYMHGMRRTPRGERLHLNLLRKKRKFDRFSRFLIFTPLFTAPLWPIHSI